MSEGKAKVRASGGLNVRSGAGTQYNRIGGLSNGATVTYTGEKSGWLKIKYNGQTGYICKSYTQITQAATSSAGSSGNASQTSKGTTMVTTASSLNVRKGPGTSYSAIGSLSYGSKVTVLGTESNGWKKISFQGGIAYISGQYVKDGTSGESASKPETAKKPEQNKPAVETSKPSSDGKSTSESKTMYTTASSLNVRKSPNVSGALCGSLVYGSAIKVLGTESNGWKKIEYNKGVAYVCGDYVTDKKPNTSGNIDVGATIGSGNLAALSTAQVASIETGRKSKQIIDLQTRKAFNVSWDACASYHSDCTPMTSADTTIFKSILHPGYSPDDPRWTNINTWSWAGRPAAIQLKNGQWVACGFHMRPHAAIMGGSPGSPFKNESNTPLSTPVNGSKWRLGGHFCLYYGDSPGGTQDCNRAAKEARNMKL